MKRRTVKTAAAALMLIAVMSLFTGCVINMAPPKAEMPVIDMDNSKSSSLTGSVIFSIDNWRSGFEYTVTVNGHEVDTAVNFGEFTINPKRMPGGVWSTINRMKVTVRDSYGTSVSAEMTFKAEAVNRAETKVSGRSVTITPVIENGREFEGKELLWTFTSLEYDSLTGNTKKTTTHREGKAGKAETFTLSSGAAPAFSYLLEYKDTDGTLRKIFGKTESVPVEFRNVFISKKTDGKTAGLDEGMMVYTVNATLDTSWEGYSWKINFSSGDRSGSTFGKVKDHYGNTYVLEFATPSFEERYYTYTIEASFEFDKGEKIKFVSDVEYF